MRVGGRSARWSAGCYSLGRVKSSGFSLLEVLVATTIMVVGVAALAQLAALAARANRTAHTTTVAAVLAQEKMEQLRSLAWGFDALSPSPAGALGQNTAGYCDFVEGNGRVLGGGTTPPPGAVYIRRWSVEPLPANPNNTLVLQVLVTRSRTSGVMRLPDDVRLVGVKTRKDP